MTITRQETEQVERANASRKSPVVFIHGLWLLPSSWERWSAFFESAGYIATTPGWPDDPHMVAEARARPEVLAGKSVGQVAAHMAEFVKQLNRKPAIVGHSFGGLLTQIVAGQGLCAVSVAIDPAPFRGVLPVPISALRAAGPVLLHPSNAGKAVSLTYTQFLYGWANALEFEEARKLYDTYHVPGPGRPLFQAAFANLNPASETKVDTRNPDRGPLLLISGNADTTVPWSVVNAAYRLQKRNPAVTEVARMPKRGHSLVIDHGWQEVAQTALDFIKRFAKP